MQDAKRQLLSQAGQVALARHPVTTVGMFALYARLW